MKKWLAFWNDEDGFSAKDYLMVVFSTVFIIFLIVAFILSITGTLPAATLTVIGMMDGIMIAIVTGVFGLQGIKEFKKSTTSSTVQYESSSYTENVPDMKAEEDVNIPVENQPKLP